MKILLFIGLLALLFACNREFEPDLRGKKAYTVPSRALIYIGANGKERRIPITGADNIGYRYAQWAKSGDQILVAQLINRDSCTDFQIVSVDTTGNVTDTLYSAPPRTAVNFKLAPNDSILLVKTYRDNCVDPSTDYKYFFFNRYGGKAPSDTVRVSNARGIPVLETVWSPDSRKVIIQEWFGPMVQAYAFDLVTKDTTYIDKGKNFVWSPTDNHIVAYIDGYSIYTRNIENGKKTLVFEGRKKRNAKEFRWSPDGKFLMILYRSYLLNIEAPPLTATKVIYYSIDEERESRVFFDDRLYDTWKLETKEQ